MICVGKFPSLNLCLINFVLPPIMHECWQESALVIARLLLPQIFEKMAMHEIRVLVAERSTMNIYIKGEEIELEQNYIGILLEGFLRTKNLNLITPPGVLLPSNTDLSLFGLESSGFQLNSVLLSFLPK